MFLQRTIRSSAKVSGIGLHTGRAAELTFRPAPSGSGVHFVRSDLPGRPSIKVQPGMVQATAMATTLGGSLFSVSTVEHCLSTLAAFRIDNLIIELDGPEIPIGDGSALPFLRALDEAGLFEQEEARQYLYVTQPIFLGEGEKHAYVLPYNGLKITCSIDFPHPAIGLQQMDLDINEASFAREVAGARTFGFLRDVEAMRARGLALGGSLENAVVMDEKTVLNPEGLRWSDEFVRHKVLDALGDLVTLGQPLMGHVVLFKAGHDVMNRLVKKILASPESFRQLELGAAPDTSAFSSCHNG